MNHLVANDARDVIRLLSDLFIFAYEQKLGIKNNPNELQTTLHQGSEILFENEATSRLYIDQFLSQHHVSNYHHKIILKWRGAKKHNLYMMDEGSDVALLFDKEEDLVYGVKGLTDALSYTYRAQTVPVKLHNAILPFRNFYIVDAMGMTYAVVDMEEMIELYEGFRSASLHKQVKISETETMEIFHLARTMQDDINDVFMDYIRPMLNIVQKMPDALESMVSTLLRIWNEANQEIDTLQEMDGYETFILPMIKRKKETFAQYRQIFAGCKLYTDENGLLQCNLEVRKEKVEQISLFERG